jgi:hypothetical protein
MSDTDIPDHQPDSSDPLSLNDRIDTWLKESRPERYDDQDWMESTVDKVVEVYENEDTKKVLTESARLRVHLREGNALRQLKTVLRAISKNGQLPLGWDHEGWEIMLQMLKDVHHLPLELGDYERISLRAMSPEDGEKWLLNEKRKEEVRQQAEKQANDGMTLLIKSMRDHDIQRVDRLGEQ